MVVVVMCMTTSLVRTSHILNPLGIYKPLAGLHSQPSLNEISICKKFA